MLLIASVVFLMGQVKMSAVSGHYNELFFSMYDPNMERQIH